VHFPVGISTRLKIDISRQKSIFPSRNNTSPPANHFPPHVLLFAFTLFVFINPLYRLFNLLWISTLPHIFQLTDPLYFPRTRLIEGLLPGAGIGAAAGVPEASAGVVAAGEESGGVLPH
jgi:hypothetical protein